MIKQISLEEFEKILSEKPKFTHEMVTENLLSLEITSQDKRHFVIHCSKVFEIIKED